MFPEWRVGVSAVATRRKPGSRTASGEPAVIFLPTSDNHAGFVCRAAAERLIYGRPYRWRERGMQHSICSGPYSFGDINKWSKRLLSRPE